MKKLKTVTLALALLLSATAPSRLGAQTLLRVKVVNEAEHPLAGVSFRIAFVGDYRSDPNGERSLTLPQDLRPGQPLAFELKNDTLAIWSPVAGKDKVPDRDPIVLKLLPKGDHRLLNRDEMKQVMNKLISEAAKKATALLQAEKAKLEQQLASAPVAGAPGDPLAEEAQRLGFSKEQLLAAIDQVKQQLQESDDPYEAGLAKLYDKKYPQAAELIARSIAQDEKLIRSAEEKKEKLPEKWLNLANARAGENDLVGAIAAYEKVIALQPQNGNAYLLLGLVQQIKGDNAAVLHNWKKALAIYRSESFGRPTENESAALGNLGLVFSDLGKPDSARGYHQAALKIAREIGYRQGEANQLGNLGLVFRALGKPDSARVYHQAALKIHREIGYRQGEASDLGNLGLVFSDLGKPDSARVYHQAALKIAREIGHRLNEAAQLGNLGLVFSDLGKPDSARVYHQAALKIAREIGYRQGEANHLGNLGLVFSALGKPDSARVYHQAALKIAREIGYRQGEANHLGNLGLVFSALGKPDSARVYLQQSLKIFVEVQSPMAISALGQLSFLFHERLFRFSEGFAIDQQRLQLDSTDLSAQCDFAEKHFTTNRFAECEQRLAALLANAEVEPSTKIALRAIGIANTLAQNKTQQVPAELETLQQNLAAQPDTFQVGWTFEGTKHFISTNEALAPHRVWLLQFFAALERKEGRAVILAGLKEARENFKAK